jgi:hypothetical protein
MTRKKFILDLESVFIDAVNDCDPFILHSLTDKALYDIVNSVPSWVRWCMIDAMDNLSDEL